MDGPEAQSTSKRRGFSIIELLVVVAIILIVVSLVIVVLAKTWRVVERFRSGS